MASLFSTGYTINMMNGEGAGRIGVFLIALFAKIWPKCCRNADMALFSDVWPLQVANGAADHDKLASS